MKLNFAYPATGQQKMIDFEDEKKLRIFYDKRMAQEVEIDSLGDEWKGYVVRIGGGNDKQGFPMKQGVLINGRVRLLLKKGQSCYRPRRTGERKRKSVRGCIVDANLSALNLVVVKKGDGEIEGLTDQVQPRKLGPKRASKIRKLFNLSKEDDVRKYVITHEKVKEGKKTRVIAPKIQRLITPSVIARRKSAMRKRHQQQLNSREQAVEYKKLLAKYAKEASEERARRRSSASHSSETSGPTKPAGKAVPAKPAAKTAPVKPAAVGKAAAPAKAAPAKAPAKTAAAPAKTTAPAKSAAAKKPAKK